jgi:hypothetical protein
VLKQLAPSVRRVAVLHDPGIAANMAFLRTAEAVSGTFGVTVTTAGVRSAEQIERTLIEFAKEPDGGLIVAPAPPTFGNRQMIADNCKPKAITSHENRCFHVLRNRSGSFATFAAIRRASSRVLAAGIFHARRLEQGRALARCTPGAVTTAKPRRPSIVLLQLDLSQSGP